MIKANTEGKSMNPNEVKPTSIRIPNWLREKIKEKAKQERRSFNSMAEILLEKSLQK